MPATWKNLSGPVKEPTPQPPGLNHFTCYTASYVAGSKHYAAPGTVSLLDEFSTKSVTVKVGGPELLCLPTEKVVVAQDGTTVDYPIINPNKHLLCLKVTQTPFIPNVYDENQFGSSEVDINGTSFLCLPSTKKIITTGSD